MRTACTLILLFGVLALGASTLTMQPRPLLHTSGDRETVNLYEYGFEDGLNGWTTLDGTAPGNWAEAWTLSDSSAYSGQSWWMHDPDIDGYTNHRYIVLDTPDIALPGGSPELTFRLSYAMEGLGGTGPYDAWDGANVRISSDGGDTWQVLTGSPAYNASDVYSFGEIFGEGTDIPGWTAQSNGWLDASFSLSQWAGQTVRIRFAFASDDATCTNDDEGDPSWFGVRLDDISVGDVFLSNGDGATGDAGMTSGFSGVTSGDYWELDTATAHSGGSSMHCPVEPNLRDELLTPYTFVEYNTHASLRYWTRLDLPDDDSNSDGIPDDYLAVYAKGKNEPTWTRLHWLTGESGADWRDVYTGAADIVGDCNLSSWTGDSLQIKFVLVTDDDNDGGQGAGAWIDDIIISYDTDLYPAMNLQAEFVDGATNLTWDAPDFSNEVGWIFWDNGANYESIGIGESANIDVATRYGAPDLAPYVGGFLTRVRIFPKEQNCDYTIRLWTGYYPVLAYEQTVESPLINSFTFVTLDEPFPISLDEILWIGYEANTQTGFPCGCDSGPLMYGAGGWIRIDGGAWEQLTDNNDLLDYNWNIRGYVSAPDGRELPLWPHQPQLREDTLSGYVVHRGLAPDSIDDEIGVVANAAQLAWSDDAPALNDENFYTVRAWYNGDTSQTSAPSNFASAFAPSSSMSHLAFDDGVSESIFSPVAGVVCANEFIPTGTMAVRQIEVYLTDIPTGLLPVRVWSEADGAPGELLSDFAVQPTWLHTGWNVIDLPSAVEVEDTFYAGIVGTVSSETLGVDNSLNGYSWTHDGEWQPYTDGVFMIRAWADTNLPVSDGSAPAPAINLANFPNPFNPETTVAFSMREPGRARLDVYNLRGQRVTTLLDDTLTAGDHTVTWRAEGLASGVYMLRLQAGGHSETRKAALLK